MPDQCVSWIPHEWPWKTQIIFYLLWAAIVRKLGKYFCNKKCDQGTLTYMQGRLFNSLLRRRQTRNVFTSSIFVQQICNQISLPPIICLTILVLKDAALVQTLVLGLRVSEQSERRTGRQTDTAKLIFTLQMFLIFLLLLPIDYTSTSFVLVQFQPDFEWTIFYWNPPAE